MKTLTTLRSDIRKKLRSSSLVSKIYYVLHIDDLPIVLGANTYKKHIEEVIEKYAKSLDKKTKESLKKDIDQCYLKYKISPTEYFLFNFRNLPEEERAEYLSDKFIYMTMGKVVGRKLHDEQLENKYNFYQLTKPFFKRKAMLIGSQNDRKPFEEFTKEISDVIIKPNTSACGNGIFLEHIHSIAESQAVFDKVLRMGGEWIVEELIHQSDKLASWNSSCVNTVRVSSFLGNEGFFVLCPFLRTGRKGAVVDNGGQGGLYAAIDPETGRVATNGKDELCNVYLEHPDSHVVYKGWQVPQWESLMKLTKEVHRLLPKHKYIGWDFAHTDDGWVLIEGNWGEFIAQQSTMERGYKKEFVKYVQQN